MFISTGLGNIELDPATVYPRFQPTLTEISSSQGIAIVTGASQSIGRAIALRLADDSFDVGVNDLRSILKVFYNR